MAAFDGLNRYFLERGYRIPDTNELFLCQTNMFQSSKDDELHRRRSDPGERKGFPLLSIDFGRYLKDWQTAWTSIEMSRSCRGRAEPNKWLDGWRDATEAHWEWPSSTVQNLALTRSLARPWSGLDPFVQRRLE